MNRHPSNLKLRVAYISLRHNSKLESAEMVTCRFHVLSNASMDELESWMGAFIDRITTLKVDGDE